MSILLIVYIYISLSNLLVLRKLSINLINLMLLILTIIPIAIEGRMGRIDSRLVSAYFKTHYGKGKSYFDFSY